MSADIIRVNGSVVEYMDEEEIFDLSERLALCARMFGLSGHALDQALGTAFSVSVHIIERERALKEQRRTNLSLVGDQ